MQFVIQSNLYIQEMCCTLFLYIRRILNAIVVKIHSWSQIFGICWSYGYRLTVSEVGNRIL